MGNPYVKLNFPENLAELGIHGDPPDSLSDSIIPSKGDFMTFTELTTDVDRAQVFEVKYLLYSTRAGIIVRIDLDLVVVSGVGALPCG